MRTRSWLRPVAAALLSVLTAVTLFAAASFPSSVKSFTTKVAGDTVQPSHINDLQAEVTAIENALLNGGYTTAANGVTFPATQSASSNVNTLDDYEEGTFTPTITSTGGGVPTYTIQSASYTKIGRVVHVEGRVSLATKGTLAAGQVGIGGLPFTSQNTSNLYSSGAIVPISGMTTSVVSMYGYVQPNTATFLLSHMTAAATAITATQVADVSTGVDFVFQVTYFTAT